MAVLELLIIFAVTFLVYKYARYIYRHRGMPPCPSEGYLPLVGHFFHTIKFLATADGLPNEIINSRKHGPIFTTWIPGFVIVTIQDFELMKEMTARRGDEFVDRPVSEFNDFLPIAKNTSGIVNTNGEIWRHNRRFSLQWLRNFGFGKNLMEQRINSQIDKMIEWLAEDVANAEQDGQEVAIIDFDLPLKFCISSIIAQMALGVGYDRGDKKYLELEKAMDKVFGLFSDPRVIPLLFFPWLRHVPVRQHFGFDIVQNACQPLDKYYSTELDRIKQEFTPGSEPSNIVEAYLAEMYEEEQKGNKPKFGDEQIKGVIGDLWGAGMETTANTSLWALLYMINYPEVQEKVFQQIKEVCGLERRPGLVDQKDMPYVWAVINEVQRLANIIPQSVAHSPVKDTTLAGYRIPKGVTLQYSTMSLHYDPAIYPEPEKFKPERFLEEDGKTLKKIDELLPFGMGKRVCLGESMARQELFLIFTAIIQRFKLGVVPGEEKPTLRYRMKGTVSTHPYKAAVSSRF